MAKIIPSLSSCLSRMTSGEKRLARRLEEYLEDDYLIWYDIPIGKKRRYPDFIILHPGRGILCLEVKDWSLENIKSINSRTVELITHKGLVTQPNPLDQARQYTFEVINKLSIDEQLKQHEGIRKGKFCMPYGHGVVFTNITRTNFNKSCQGLMDEVLPCHLIVFKDEIKEGLDAEIFQQKLWSMFSYKFGKKLSLPQIDRIRWHLFPELRIDAPQKELFSVDSEDEEDGDNRIEIPNIVKVMDIQQEQLARSLGEGHRVIHGVAGSGKTLILGFRCQFLVKTSTKPILVLCFNATLGSRLREFIEEKGISNKVNVYHFHDWCNCQLETYHVDVVEGVGPQYQRRVESVIKGVENGLIPRAQYGAILIDEGHDFEPEWLKLVVQMIDEESNSLLLLYDDAQSIYKKQSLGFSLSSVGVQAQGRTTILRSNYRNTREIAKFAYRFAHEFFRNDKFEDNSEFIAPEAVGESGPNPVYRQFATSDEEIEFVIKCIKRWRESGVSLKDVAILYPTYSVGKVLYKELKIQDIASRFIVNHNDKKNYKSNGDEVKILTIFSSKGLEYERVIMIGFGQFSLDTVDVERDVRTLYVGMTRARKNLLITSSNDNEYAVQLRKIALH